MNLPLETGHLAKVEQFQRRHHTAMLALLFTDLVGSTKLKQTFGDMPAVSLIQEHHALVRRLLSDFKEAEEIDTAGDSFFIMFLRPSDAVRFALQLQAELRAAASHGGVLQDRVGIHIGEVVIQENPDTLRQKNLFGIQVDTTARVMSLAEGGQILLSHVAFDNARPVLKGEDIAGLGPLSWMNHGSYLMKGVEDPLEICEVGEAGKAPLHPPPDSEKVHRHAGAGGEPVLGWRPALGQAVPNTQWILQRKLGEGGFGEVWLAENKNLLTPRVFKFCFRADRVRSLKREVKIFQILRERLGQQPNIVGVHDVFFDHPPFYLVMDFGGDHDLNGWCEQRGGLDKIPLATRLEVVAQVADALQAAHDAGVIHRDVKPSNILISETRTLGGPPQPTIKLTDFGIGQVVSSELLSGMTRGGFSMSLAEDYSAQSGTLLYLAPELAAGKPASIRSDIYSLGIVLFQMIVGDFSRPVTADWPKEISNPLLHDDLAGCLAGNPQERFAGAAQLAKRLRTLGEREQALQEQRAAAAARERAAYRAGIMRVGALALGVCLIVAGLAVYAFRQAATARQLAGKEKQQLEVIEQRDLAIRQNLYAADMGLVENAWRDDNVSLARVTLDACVPQPGQPDLRGFEWWYENHLCAGEQLSTLTGHSNYVADVAFSPDGKTLASAGYDHHVILWDVHSRQPSATIAAHAGPVENVSFTRDGKMFATSGDDGTVKFWDAATRQPVFTIQTGRNPRIALSPTADLVAIAENTDASGRIGNCQLWDYTARHQVDFHAAAGRVAFSPDGKTLATTTEDSIRLWNAATGQPAGVLSERTGTLLSRQILSLAIAPDNSQVAASDYGGRVTVWSLADKQIAAFLAGHELRIWKIAFSPDGLTLATASADQTIRLWNMNTYKEGDRRLRGHDDEVLSVAFSPDGNTLASADKDETVRLWNVSRSQQADTITGVGSRPVFSSDGRLMAARSGLVTLFRTNLVEETWDVKTGKPLQSAPENLVPLCFYLDGRRLLTHEPRSDGTDQITLQVLSLVSNSVQKPSASRRLA